MATLEDSLHCLFFWRWSLISWLVPSRSVLMLISSFLCIRSSKTSKMEVFLLLLVVPLASLMKFVCWWDLFVSWSFETVFHSQIIFEVLLSLGCFASPTCSHNFLSVFCLSFYLFSSLYKASYMFFFLYSVLACIRARPYDLSISLFLFIQSKVLFCEKKKRIK